ncbi:MAG TPA: SpoIIE family protein phosphatase [Candidatus Angelobacter sp.]|nr:SpoIIE family protein phosphatase [Candidatus Angelobacter sp.]
MNQKILFVDDEPAALRLYRQLLKCDFDISTAAGGEDGIAMLRELGPFAIVVSDMRMPGMDGVEFLKRVRQLAPNTMRLLLTGHVDLSGAVTAVNEGGIFRLLMKPCEESVLTEAITSALACYHQRKEERVRIELPVHLYRSTTGQKVQSAHTVDISNSGARLGGLEEPLELGEVLKVECGNRRAPFRVVWTGVPGTASERQVGLECLAPNAGIWELDPGQMENDQLMSRARVVQCGLLPQEKPQLKTLDYAGHCIQARMVGGDYYDFLDLGPGEVGFVLADVSGNGVPAALLMAGLQGTLHSQSATMSNDLPQLLASLNIYLHKHSTNQRYVTMFFGRYSDATRTLQYVNCGHNPPILIRKEGIVERLDATATVLGLFPDWECSVATVQLETGDVLGMYTDGITETSGENDGEFGEAGLLQTLRKHRDLEAAQILRKVEDAVEQFRVGEQEDDLTLLIARAR